MLFIGTLSEFAHIFSILAENIFDLQYSLPMSRKDKSDLEPHPETNLDDDLDFFTSGMAHTGNSSPFIKDEPEEYSFLANNFPSSQRGYNMQIGQQFGDGASANIDPSELSMQNGNFAQYNMGSQQNMSNSFNLANSGINDDELLDLDLNDGSHHHNFSQGQNGFGGQANMQNYMTNQGQANGQNQINQIYSSTPDGAPIQSPFTHSNFNYAHLAQIQQQQQMSQASPQMRPNPLNMHGRSLDTSYMNTRPRSNMSATLERQASDSRSPMTPKTPGLSTLNLDTPDSSSLPSQPIHANFNNHRHQKTLSGQWDSTPGSLHSNLDSPISSPGYQANHAQISDVLKTGHHASLPAKVEPGHHPVPAYQTQEAKRRRRRESHNMVERRRRDNINEKIQELSQLVPGHRLEDERVRKHLMNNSPLSPTLGATGISPPQATSLLAAGGRRATGAGSISMGIPPEEKDKGPNKGDILNGSVSWTRDLMWALHIKLQQESELAEYIASLGGQFPFEQTEDDRRMRTELLAAMEENNPNTFSYTRGPGSGLRVPNHTNPAGEPLNQSHMGTLSPQSLSPGAQSGGSGANGQQQYWNQTFKEEDEYAMETN